MVQHTGHVIATLKSKQTLSCYTFISCQPDFAYRLYDETSRSWIKFVGIECGVSSKAGVWGRLNLLVYYLKSLLKSLNIVVEQAI